MSRDPLECAAIVDGVAVTLSRGRTTCGVRARFLGPLGLYPPAVAGDCNHGYLFNRDGPITLVRVAEHPGQYEDYSEVEWAHPEEIGFFASMALGREDNAQAVIIYPLSYGYRVEIDADIPLNTPELLHAVQALMIKMVVTERSQRRRRFPGIQWESDDLPPFRSKRKYGESTGMVPERQAAALAAIDPTDFLMIRGLSTWLRSCMLSTHMHFIEESITTLFISMEASFRLVRRRLIAEGIRDPNAKDAAVFLGKVFNEEPLERYFAEYYDDRIATMHPESRFGVFLHPPLMVDDFYHLHGSLRDLYLYLLTGWVDPQWLNRWT
jgi:hypothetical protein